MTYAVFTPARTFKGTAVVPMLVTDDQAEAITFATQRRDEFLARGWVRWAKLVTIQQPNNPEAYMELASRVADYGHMADINSNGNSFLGQRLINWANILRVRAAELANPEAYAF
jgi:hypothetical protein